MPCFAISEIAKARLLKNCREIIESNRLIKDKINSAPQPNEVRIII